MRVPWLCHAACISASAAAVPSTPARPQPVNTHALSLNSGDLVPPWHCGLRVAAFDVTFPHHPSTAAGLPCNESLDSILSVETAHVHVEYPQRVSTLPSRATEFVISQESPSCLHPASTGKLSLPTLRPHMRRHTWQRMRKQRKASGH